MKNRKSTACLLILAAAASLTGCEDSRNEYLEDYQTMIYFRNGGEQDITLYRVGEDTWYEIPVCKGGRDLEGTATATVVSMNRTQIDIYNMDNGTDYTQLPGEYWDFVEYDNETVAIEEPVSLTFTSSDSWQVVKVRMHTNEISALEEANPDNTYVLALQVYADPKVSPDINIIIIRPTIDIPQLSLANTGVVSNYYTSGSPLSNDYSNNAVLGMDNRWDFNVTVGTEDQNWLSSYNGENGTSYTLLPADAYSFSPAYKDEDGTSSSAMSTVPFTTGSSRSAFSVTVNRNELELLTEYMLPVTITDCSKPEFAVSENDAHWLLTFRLDPDEITLTESMLSSPFTVSGDGAGLIALVSDPTSNWWHSNYNGTTTGDAIYGHYIDISLSEPLTDIVLSYQTRTSNSNGVPTHIVIGVTNDENAINVNTGTTDAWTQIGEVTSGLATDAGEWCTLPAFHSETPFSYIRFGIAESLLGNLRVTDSGTALSGLRLYGANTAN